MRNVGKAEVGDRVRLLNHLPGDIRGKSGTVVEVNHIPFEAWDYRSGRFVNRKRRKYVIDLEGGGRRSLVASAFERA